MRDPEGTRRENRNGSRGEEEAREPADSGSNARTSDEAQTLVFSLAGLIPLLKTGYYAPGSNRAEFGEFSFV